MLSMMSWGEFGLVLSVLTLVYYGLVGYCCYRREILAWFRPKALAQGPKILPLHAANFMGMAKPIEEGVEVASAEELVFAEVEEHGETAMADVVVAKTVVTEVKELIGYAAGAKESKEGLLTLLGLYLERADISQRRELAVFMLGECEGKFSFELSLSDLKLDVETDDFSDVGAGEGGTLGKGMLAVLCVLLYGSMSALAQDGNSGIAEATSKVRSYFATGCNLMYAIGAVIGLIGAVKVYQKWNGGDGDTGKVAASWFGSCIFLVVVATVLQSFFGI